MRCKACWREAQRMARRGGAPDNAMRRVTKRIYLAYHVAEMPLSEVQPEWLNLPASDCGHPRHIKEGGYRRHKSGKVILAAENRS